MTGVAGRRQLMLPSSGNNVVKVDQTSPLSETTPDTRPTTAPRRGGSALQRDAPSGYLLHGLLRLVFRRPLRWTKLVCGGSNPHRLNFEKRQLVWLEAKGL